MFIYVTDVLCFIVFSEGIVENIAALVERSWFSISRPWHLIGNDQPTNLVRPTMRDQNPATLQAIDLIPAHISAEKL